MFCAATSKITSSEEAPPHFSPHSKKARGWVDSPTFFQPLPLGVDLPGGTVRVEGVKLDVTSLASMTVVDDLMSEEVMWDVPNQGIEELRAPVCLNDYECSYYSEENDLFPRPMHRLSCR